MDITQTQEQFEKYVVANYNRLPVCIVEGKGSKVKDSDGNEYLDLFPGWGVAGLGHCHPKVVEAISRQAGKLIHVANNYYSPEQGKFAEVIADKAQGYKVFFCNSGAEANEAAIKLARIIVENRYKIITFENSFHGRTLATLTATGQPEYQKGFAPLVPGFKYAKINDLTSVLEQLDNDVCAIMIEPVQGEAGVIPATQEFLQGLRKICDERGILLIFDEVQTAPARLGTWFGFQYFGVTPDIITSAKAIAGGFPLGVMLAKSDIADYLKPGMHASTFGGNALGCAAGIAAFKVIEEENILQKINDLGEWLDQKLEGLKQMSRDVKDIRRCGFMIGIDLYLPGVDIVTDCRNHGLLINCTHQTTLRLLPAFNIEKEELAKGLDILADCLARAARKAGSVRIMLDKKNY